MGGYLRGLSSALERLTADQPEASQQQLSITCDTPPAGRTRAATAAEQHAAAASSPKRHQHAGARHSAHPAHHLDIELDHLQEHALATAPVPHNAIAAPTPALKVGACCLAALMTDIIALAYIRLYSSDNRRCTSSLSGAFALLISLQHLRSAAVAHLMFLHATCQRKVVQRKWCSL